jgi:hypothetical protein
MSTFPVLLAFMLSFSTNNNDLPGPGPVNYLNTPLSLAFNDKNYHLVWSSHPSATYYKQEYLAKGETVEKYSSMLMLEVLDASLNPGDAAAAKIAEILEFTITANSPDGRQVLISENNVYRYTLFTNPKGAQSLLLFALSYRQYGNDAVKVIKADKNDGMIVDQVRKFAIPRVTLK